jgi:hypothetical protein
MAKKRRRVSGSTRAELRRADDVQRRLTEVEEMARANRRELELQFRRIADMQMEIDALKKR